MSALNVLLAGDLILDYPNPDHWLSGIAPAVRKADVAIGHLEVPHTTRGFELKGDVPAPGANPEHVGALARAGFAAVSLAGNHMADCGAEGIEDTIAALDRAGIAHAGAGANLSSAKAPLRLDRHGRSLALLSYNCVGPENSWATETRAGCAFVRVATSDGSVIAPAAPLTHPDPESLEQLRTGIKAARKISDIVIVSLHKGLVHRPVQLAQYEQPIAHAAIDAGADIVAGHHSHIVHGIEIYRGKPIFHGLGNGCVVTKALSPDQSHPARAAWARKRRELFGFEPDPAYELAPFHPEAINAMLGVVRFVDGSMRVGVRPVHVEAPGRPVLANEEQSQRIADYVERITRDAGLPPIRLEFEEEIAWLN